MRPKGEAPNTDKGTEQTANHPGAPHITTVPAGPAAATAGAWNVVTPRKTVQRTPLGHTSPQNTAPPPPSSSPTPNARSRHITMRFATRKEVNLPEGSRWKESGIGSTSHCSAKEGSGARCHMSE